MSTVMIRRCASCRFLLILLYLAIFMINIGRADFHSFHLPSHKAETVFWTHLLRGRGTSTAGDANAAEAAPQGQHNNDQHRPTHEGVHVENSPPAPTRTTTSYKNYSRDSTKDDDEHSRDDLSPRRASSSWVCSSKEHLRLFHCPLLLRHI
ncbi:unnamed protein product [Amoebophrya sp. A25]|nr:unnamed protein product [Amoebophrya sp. A25]|eukprot:GSA25T00016116001.1